MHRAGLVRLVRMGLVYLLVAAAAALGWLWQVRRWQRHWGNVSAA